MMLQGKLEGIGHGGLPTGFFQALIDSVNWTTLIPLSLSVTVTAKVMCDGAPCGGVPRSVPLALRVSQVGRPLALQE